MQCVITQREQADGHANLGLLGLVQPMPCAYFFGGNDTNDSGENSVQFLECGDLTWPCFAPTQKICKADDKSRALQLTV
jgi:hypothetical protein